jgi:hypothetical protein
VSARTPSRPAAARELKRARQVVRDLGDRATDIDTARVKKAETIWDHVRDPQGATP